MARAWAVCFARCCAARHSWKLRCVACSSTPSLPLDNSSTFNPGTRYASAPPSPAKGANFTITVNGNCPADVTTATYDATGTFAGIPVLKVLGNSGCGDTDFPVGGALNLGHMYIGGVTCPVKGGAAMVLDNKAFISKLAPPGTLKSSLTTYDQDKKPLFKILLDVTS